VGAVVLVCECVVVVASPGGPSRAELALRVAEREPAYCWNDPAGLGRSLPGLAVVDRPALVATWRSLTLPAGRAVPAPCESRPPKSVTFESDHKGQPLSKAGASLLRTTLVCCRQQCGKVDPQLGAATKLSVGGRGGQEPPRPCALTAAYLAHPAGQNMDRAVPHVI